jgi:hypothetical protein
VEFIKRNGKILQVIGKYNIEIDILKLIMNFRTNAKICFSFMQNLLNFQATKMAHPWREVELVSGCINVVAPAPWDTQQQKKIVSIHCSSAQGTETSTAKPKDVTITNVFHHKIFPKVWK